MQSYFAFFFAHFGASTGEICFSSTDEQANKSFRRFTSIKALAPEMQIDDLVTEVEMAR